VYLKNIGDCVPSRDKSIGTPLDPPLFWLDNIFKNTSKVLYILSAAYIDAHFSEK
jgi:hypothetical protein